MDNAKFLADVNTLEATLADRAVVLEGGDIGAEICRIYAVVKPVLSIALPFIKLIPVFGSQLAAGLEALMKLLDGILSEAVTLGHSNNGPAAGACRVSYNSIDIKEDI